MQNFGVPQKEGAKREQLAYLLDEDHMARVPPTFYVDFSAFKHPQDDHPLGVGSLQYYEYAYHTPSERQEDLRAILIHNLAILNLDVQFIFGEDGRYISIDHGYSLPQKLDTKPNLGPAHHCNLAPFSEKEKEYIQKLSSERFANVLQEHGVSPAAIQLQQAILQMLKIATKTNHITLRHLLSLFHRGKFYGGGYSGYFYADFRPELIAIASAKTEEERLAAIQKAFEIVQSEDRRV